MGPKTLPTIWGTYYVSTATFFLLHCDEWDRVVALPRHKFVTGATLLQLLLVYLYSITEQNISLSRRFDNKPVRP
jgi:hypothetical protein